MKVASLMVVLAFAVITSFFWARKLDRDFKWETSPCGTRMEISDYLLGENNPKTDARDYRDDGERVWRIKEIRFPKGFNPHIKTAQVPEIVWEVAMERTPQACEAWIAKTGIDRRQKEKPKK